MRFYNTLIKANESTSFCLTTILFNKRNIHSRDVRLCLWNEVMRINKAAESVTQVSYAPSQYSRI